MKQAIGVFDSGYGGLTILNEFVRILPDYDYIYLGDSARTPYGTRSFESVYRFTLECVKKLFNMNCHLIILACNTASAKALRTIQQKDIPLIASGKRVLGVIRPTTEIIGNFSKTKRVGILGTTGTVNSDSYPIEIRKFFPDLKVYQQACPLFVPLIENDEYNNRGTEYFIEKYITALLSQDKNIDTILLACTHYPLIKGLIKKYTGKNIEVISQDELVAKSLNDYLKRHPEIEKKCSKNSTRDFYTTDSPELFNRLASIFYNGNVDSKHIDM